MFTNPDASVLAGQRIKLGSAHRGKLVTVVIEDTHLRIMHGEEEIAVRPRRSAKNRSPPLRHRQRNTPNRRSSIS
ncbi:hypothetical protein IU459_35630 [Nocardia amamiensis]|uniref:Uncharacterized protein n=1 Tax=Nocardia amamiensis TaxID=404578 RepID=A0ABS0D3Y5_9NOCA|nr:hypothetical protein [Nocardia amamiensis]MBF6302823.1 hypothetical protein [Nocardia amamiensis]